MKDVTGMKSDLKIYGKLGTSSPRMIDQLTSSIMAPGKRKQTWRKSRKYQKIGKLRMKHTRRNKYRNYQACMMMKIQNPSLLKNQTLMKRMRSSNSKSSTTPTLRRKDARCDITFGRTFGETYLRILPTKLGKKRIVYQSPTTNRKPHSAKDRIGKKSKKKDVLLG